MDEKSAPARGPAPRTLPFLVAVPALVLYLATVCRWLNPLNIETVGQTAGWLWQLPYQNPLLFLVCLPLRVLPDSLYPLGCNLLAAVMGAATLWLLARSVMLLPYDRTREGRIRGHADDTQLHIPLAWVPPVFAAALAGFQLSFWEHATAQTGEMLDLLVFAYCIRCLLEYRVEVQENWLWRMALVYGLGVTNNWAMIGFFPLFLTALIWIRGFSFFNFGFLLRLAGFGFAGLLLYAFMPAWVSVTNRVDASFTQSLYSVLISQKTVLIGMPRGRALMLGLVCILPFIAMGIRWAGTRGSSIERVIASGAVYLMKLSWLVLCVVIAFDLPFSPRVLVQNEIGLPMLSYYYLAALVAGYFVGLFMLVLGTQPDRMHGPASPMPAVISKVLYFVILGGALAAPCVLAARSFPKVRDTGLLSDLAIELTRPLPNQPSILVADNMAYLWLAEAQRRRTPNAPEHLLIHTGDARREDYQKYLERRYAGSWPDVTKFTKADSAVLGEFLNLLVAYGKQGRAYYLHHSFGRFFELIQIRPRGLINEIRDYAPEEILQAPLTPEEIQRNRELWNQAITALTPHVGGSKMPAIARIISRAANHAGVEFQRAGQLDDARKSFEFAVAVHEKNVVAQANRAGNEALRAGKPTGVEPSKALADYSLPKALSAAINAYGPVDTPAELRTFGRSCADSPDELFRQAIQAFDRMRGIAPGDFSATALLASAYIAAGYPDKALVFVQELRQRHAQKPLPPAEFGEMVGIEANARLQKGDNDGALKLVQDARSAQPDNPAVLDTLSKLLIARGTYDEAARVAGEWVRLKPEDTVAQLRRTTVLMLQQQWQPAVDGLTAVIKRDPNNRVALMNRAISLLQLKRYDDARRDFNRIAEEFPNLPQVHFGLGEIAAQKKDIAGAIEHFERYRKVAKPNTPEYSNVVQRISTLKAGKR